MRLSALDRKLLRDLVAMKGQVVAIALIIGAAMALFVMYLSNFDSLRRTQEAYYERQRFADIFATLKRAPEALAARLAALPGVAQVETRVVADVVLDIPGMQEPATGRLISIPAGRRPALNDLSLREGGWVSPGRPDEVVAAESFARAHGFHVGDQVSVILNGRKRPLTIVGVALSPEYVTASAPARSSPTPAASGSSGWSDGPWPPPPTWRAGSTTWSSAGSAAPGRSRSSPRSTACWPATAGAGPSPGRSSSPTGR